MLPPNDIDQCITLLEQLADDPALIASLDGERHRALMMAAGRVSRPDRLTQFQRARALRQHLKRQQRQHDLRVLDGTEIRSAQRASIFVAPPLRALPAPPDAAERPELLEPRACYVCKADYRQVHFFYDSMCPPCAALNYDKRHQTARLDDQVVLITGARLKIGYHTSLMLLRAGARVIATTRFPKDAAVRYAREPDFASFHDRLQIHGLDLRHAPSVELFTRYLSETAGRLDHIINNAAQTVRRPPAFYAHLLPRERTPLDALPPSARGLLAAHLRLTTELGYEGESPAESQAGVVRWHGDAAAAGLVDSAGMSQVPCAPGDLEADEAFPAGEVDPDLQQIDRRTLNSWRLPLSEVSTPELLEVHLVNAVAPFILNSKLKPLMLRQRTFQKHIVNVSAMEAQFSRHKKTDKHPHTNMAKAALNMMTRTSAVDYAQDGIYMNSVDTGWVTDEDPLHHVVRKQDVHDFHPPLDVVDGAARVCDPIFSHLRTGQPMWGLFLKDYRPTDW
jgi:NAD(P)-dependent dehydrogenase (short-subunit alcohol dehydrogenase family)